MYLTNYMCILDSLTPNIIIVIIVNFFLNHQIKLELKQYFKVSLIK